MVIVGGELFVFSKTFSPEHAIKPLAPSRQTALGVHKIENIDPLTSMWLVRFCHRSHRNTVDRCFESVKV